MHPVLLGVRRQSSESGGFPPAGRLQREKISSRGEVATETVKGKGPQENRGIFAACCVGSSLKTTCSIRHVQDATVQGPGLILLPFRNSKLKKLLAIGIPHKSIVSPKNVLRKSTTMENKGPDRNPIYQFSQSPSEFSLNQLKTKA